MFIFKTRRFHCTLLEQHISTNSNFTDKKGILSGELDRCHNYVLIINPDGQ